jgi:uncharacterized protein YndB with AHSA1/START domain
MGEPVTVEADINAPIEKVWRYYTEPNHITKWNNASSDWHTPWAKNDLKVGGDFAYRMESRVTKEGFEFGGKYTEVKNHEIISYVMQDGRKARAEFHQKGDRTHLKVTFDPEEENPVQMQREGWQAILNNFKRYVESS